LKNTVYEFGTLLQCFNGRSLNYQSVTVIAHNVLWSVCYQLHSVEGCGKCPTVPQRCELTTAGHALLDERVNKLVK